MNEYRGLTGDIVLAKLRAEMRIQIVVIQNDISHCI